MFKIKTSIIIALVVFLVTLVLTVPNSYLVNKFAGPIEMLPVNIQSIDGSISTGSIVVDYEGIKTQVDWSLKPGALLLGKVKADVIISILDSQLTANVVLGLNSLNIQHVNGQLSYATISKLGQSQRLEVEGDVSIQNIAFKITQASMENESGDISNVKTLHQLDGRMIYTGGKVTHPQFGQKEIPRLVAQINEAEGVWKISLNDDNENLLNLVDVSSDGSLVVQTYKAWSPIIGQQFRGSDPISILNYDLPTFK
ncbi:type II secretion system protein N [Marinicellulosiphila megalodicopiae]|uniref:type II secretion system protein N n=1 Tax=Marinicellulosiphila megalodicopiae TaxID=2724896 RepID=UPI003BB1C248